MIKLGDDAQHDKGVHVLVVQAKSNGGRTRDQDEQ